MTEAESEIESKALPVVDQDGVLKTKAKRQCGNCTACCTVIGVSALHKPAGQTCDHCVVHKTTRKDPGCLIYDNRPKECQDYHCLWVLGMGKPKHRPDRIGAILDAALNSQQAVVVRAIEERYQMPTLVAREVFHGGFRREDTQKMLATIAQRAVVILIYAEPEKGPARRSIIGPREVMPTIEKFLVDTINASIPLVPVHLPNSKPAEPVAEPGAEVPE